MIFYLSAYLSVSSHPPTAIPVHHDDYSNYAMGGELFEWSWVRPLSSFIIHFLAQLSPGWLIWTIRLLTIAFVFLAWKLLCEFYRPRYYWPTLLLFGIAVFSTPIVVEYARYTGMITHLLSGCLGLAAVVFLFRQVSHPDRNYILFSSFFLVLSALAKEDFIFLYAVSLLYAILFLKAGSRKIVSWGIGGLLFCILLIAGAKFLAASNFLGVADKASTYYIDVSPSSVTNTVWRYLTGASHPAMLAHGQIVSGIFFFSALVVIFILARHKTLPRTSYFIIAALCTIAPYSVLPNHVNAYYELVWLPAILSATFMAFTELIELHSNILQRWRLLVPLLAFLVVTISLSVFDYSGRKSIAAWYDNVAESNAKTINFLHARQMQINQAGNVCIEGADSFSPWFMHNGRYLRNVMGLNATWHIIVDASSPYYAGISMGANASDKQVVITPSPDAVPTPCLHINLARLF